MFRLDSISLRQLTCFLEVCHSSNINEAADRLGITQSATSRRLIDLETALDTQLFDRRGRRLVLTTKGETFLRFAETALQKLQQGCETLTSGEGDQSDSLLIGALPTVSATLIPAAVPRLRQARPGVLIRVVTGTSDALLGQLRAESLHMIVGRLASGDAMRGMLFHPLSSDSLAFVVRAGHPLVGKSVRVADFSAYPMITPQPSAVIYPIVETFLLARGMALPQDRIESTSAPFATSFLQTSDAIWAISRGVADAAVQAGTLAFLDIDTNETIGSIGVTTSADAPDLPVVSQFIGILRDLA